MTGLRERQGSTCSCGVCISYRDGLRAKGYKKLPAGYGVFRQARVYEDFVQGSPLVLREVCGVGDR